VNLVLGSGDSGKSSVLDAISLVLSPQPSQAALETDYRNLDSSQPFQIKLVLGHLSDEFLARVYPAPLWGWDSQPGVLRSGPDEENGIESVALLEVEGNSDLELQHRILQPGNDPRPLSVPARIAAGLWSVNTNRAPDAQLRMSRGSLLERALGRDRMRAPAVAAMQGTADTLQIPEEVSKVLERLAIRLKDAGIDIKELALSLIPSGGQSPVQLLALAARSGDGQVPLASFGRGSQQIAMVTLATAEVHDAPIAVIDEIESGLEPYRQRAMVALVRGLVASDGQAFMTTHSPAVLARLGKGEAWVLRRHEEHSIGPIRGELERLMHLDPEALLSRLPIVCEGATEVGLVDFMLETLGGADPSAFGIHLIDAGGHDHALELLEALAGDGYHTCGLVDNERFSSGKRAALATAPLIRLYMAPGGRCLECAVANAIPLNAMEALTELPGTAGPFLKVVDRLQAISTRLGKQSRASLPDLVASFGEGRVRDAVGEAATTGEWFKSLDAGRQLGEFAHTNLESNHEFLTTFRDLVTWAMERVRSAHPEH